MSTVDKHATMRPDVETAIVDVVLDYFEGWYDGDVDRMTSALHEDLAKRSLAQDGRAVETISAGEMIHATAEGRGKRDDPAERALDVRVDDVYDTIANVTVTSVPYAEYVQLVRTDQGWKIVNALWQRR